MKDYGGGGTKAATPMGKGKRHRTASTVDSNSVESSSEDESMDDDTLDLVEDVGGISTPQRQQFHGDDNIVILYFITGGLKIKDCRTIVR